jgi:hypothetical protein
LILSEYLFLGMVVANLEYAIHCTDQAFCVGCWNTIGIN